MKAFVFEGPKGGIYVVTESGTHSVVKDGDYKKMDEDEVNEHLAIHEQWLASSCMPGVVHRERGSVVAVAGRGRGSPCEVL